MEGLRDRINEVRDHYRLTNRGFADTIKGSLLCEDSPCYVTSCLLGHRKQIVRPYLMYVRI